MPKSNNNVLAQRITDHEKLCRIMQKQTHARFSSIKKQIERLAIIVIYYRNSGSEWNQIPGTGLAAAMVGSIHITDDQEIYACDFAIGLFRSSNLGQNGLYFQNWLKTAVRLLIFMKMEQYLSV